MGRKADKVTEATEQIALSGILRYDDRREAFRQLLIATAKELGTAVWACDVHGIKWVFPHEDPHDVVVYNTLQAFYQKSPAALDRLVIAAKLMAPNLRGNHER